MQNINAFDHAETILKVLAKGAFLNTAAGGRHNTMTIGQYLGQTCFHCNGTSLTLYARADRSS